MDATAVINEAAGSTPFGVGRYEYNNYNEKITWEMLGYLSALNSFTLQRALIYILIIVKSSNV